MEIHQSDLAAYQRCARQKFYYDQVKLGIGPRPMQLSRTAYGTVIHHAIKVLEQLVHAGDPTALDVAIATWVHYWDPDNIAQVTEPVDEWLVRDTYGGMKEAGIRAIRDYHDLLLTDAGVLLALELEFRVPIDLGPVGQHHLVGIVDRLAIRKQKTTPYLSVEDLKSGKKPTYLRHHIQFTAYMWASTQRPFWDPFPDADERYQAYSEFARRGRWIDLRNLKYADAGWRGPADYARLKLALTEYVRAVEAGIYPLTLAGDVCIHCPFRGRPGDPPEWACGGVPVPDEDEGRPA